MSRRVATPFRVDFVSGVQMTHVGSLMVVDEISNLRAAHKHRDEHAYFVASIYVSSLGNFGERRRK